MTHRLFPMSRLLCLSLLCLPMVVSAQDLDRLEPAPVPPQVEPLSPPQPFAIEPGEVLVDELKGLVFGPSKAAVAEVDPIAGVAFPESAWLDTPELREGLTLFLGRPVDGEMLQSIPMAVRLYLAELGFPFSVVYLPEQDITAGIIRVVVLRSKVASEVVIEGATYFSPQLYRDALHLDPGSPLNQQDFHDDVAWLNRNPFRSVAIEARAGKEPGTTEIVLKVREVRPLRIFVGADNTGTETTQLERVNAGVNWGNAFGLGHQASLQATSSWDFNTLRSVSGSYALDLPWRHELSFNGAYSRTNGLVAPPFKLKGTSWQVAANYDVPLASPRTGFTQSLRFGVDFKSSDNNFTFATTPITDNLTHVAQARATWSGNLKSKAGVSSFGTTLTAAPGGLTNRNKDQYFNLSRAGAKANYVYLRANASHTIQLFKIKPGMSWSIRGQFQFSPSNLIGSEQFGGGGSTTVRGYEEGEVYKDNGFLLSQELRLPPWRFSMSKTSGGQLQTYVFQDFANLWSTDKLPGETSVDLHSAGVGADLSLSQHATLRAAYGWQFTDSGSSNSGDHSRLHLSANLSF